MPCCDVDAQASQVDQADCQVQQRQRLCIALCREPAIQVVCAARTVGHAGSDEHEASMSHLYFLHPLTFEVLRDMRLPLPASDQPNDANAATVRCHGSSSNKTLQKHPSLNSCNQNKISSSPSATQCSHSSIQASNDPLLALKVRHRHHSAFVCLSFKDGSTHRP